MKKIRWGILGAGKIAHKFAEEALIADHAEAVAIAAREEVRAQAFADQYKIKKVWANYEQLAKDPEIDCIYIATTHNFHCEHALLCLENGKHVLCEKPLAVTANQAKKMIDAAESRGLFLMEAMWTRFLPSTRKVMELIGSGAIGDIMTVHINFGFRIKDDTPATSRIVAPELAGGAVLDVGVYTISYASMLFGDERPDFIKAASQKYAPTGVDGQTCVTLGYGQKSLAVLTSAITSSMPGNAVICGTRGMITVSPFWNGGKVTLEADGQTQIFEQPPKGRGFAEEIEECSRCIALGLVESPLMKHDDTLLIAQIMDEARRQIGLAYPGE